MTIRHPRRAALASLAAVSLFGAVLPGAAAPAAAAGSKGISAKVAVTGTAKTGGTPLNMRQTASPAGLLAGVIRNGGPVAVVCQVTAGQITGTVRTTRQWNRLANGAYVSDAYVLRPAATIPACPPSAGPAPAPILEAPAIPARKADESWQVPVTAGNVSGFRSAVRPSHDGVDLAAARNTPILSAAAGTVIRVVCNVSAGTCDVDGNRTLSGCGWYVEVEHPNKIVTRYCHLVRKPVVTVGQAVAKGQLLGHVGSSGSSSGPHLHFEVHVTAPPATRANAVDPIAFFRSRGVTLR